MQLEFAVAEDLMKPWQEIVVVFEPDRLSECEIVVELFVLKELKKMPL